MNTKTDKRRVYVESLIVRLRQHYAERVPMPGKQQESISLQMLQRLYRYVTSEGYGE